MQVIITHHEVWDFSWCSCRWAASMMIIAGMLTIIVKPDDNRGDADHYCETQQEPAAQDGLRIGRALLCQHSPHFGVAVTQTHSLKLLCNLRLPTVVDFKHFKSQTHNI